MIASAATDWVSERATGTLLLPACASKLPLLLHLTDSCFPTAPVPAVRWCCSQATTAPQGRRPDWVLQGVSALLLAGLHYRFAGIFHQKTAGHVEGAHSLQFLVLGWCSTVYGTAQCNTLLVWCGVGPHSTVCDFTKYGITAHRRPACVLQPGM